MTWHYIEATDSGNSLSLQEAGVASWEGSSSDGAPSALLSMLPDHETFFSRGKPTGFWTDFQSGMTSRRLMENRGEDTLTSSPAGSPAKTSHRLIRRRKDWPARVRAFFGRCSASLMRYGLDSSLPKTLRTWSLADLHPSYKGLPKWGMTQGGACWALRMSGLPINESELGSWPTPICGRGTNFQRNRTGMMDNPEAHANRDGVLTDEQMNGTHWGGGLNVPFREWLMGWPIGWTDVESRLSETGRFQQWLRLHSISSATDSSEVDLGELPWLYREAYFG